MISLFPHLPTLFPPFPPSLISLVASVDVKHYVYLLTLIQASSVQFNVALRPYKVRDGKPKDVYLLFHTTPELRFRPVQFSSILLYVHRDSTD